MKIARDHRVGVGRGITVAGTPQHSASLQRIRELLEFARREGAQPDGVVELSDAASRSTG
ncbi:MAG TPA: hypothetical protein VG346_13545 [Acidimicrobiales bacterium]|jgi:hypothetical protein|nr:hypothetical protein [Acidimicrobiales bacterium]